MNFAQYGEFTQQTRRMIISDPCYEEGDITFRAEPGRWIAEGEEGFLLHVYHERWGSAKWTERLKDVTSDTGLQGAYDWRYYRDPEEVQGLVPEGPDPWGDAYCSLKPPILLPHGVICSTGIGDGKWAVLVGRRFHRVVAVWVVFDMEALKEVTHE